MDGFYRIGRWRGSVSLRRPSPVRDIRDLTRFMGGAAALPQNKALASVRHGFASPLGFQST